MYRHVPPSDTHTHTHITHRHMHICTHTKAHTYAHKQSSLPFLPAPHEQIAVLATLETPSTYFPGKTFPQQ